MYNPNDYRDQRRYERDQRRAQRRYSRYQNPIRGLGGAIFLIILIFAFAWPHSFAGPGFLVLLFVGLAFLTLFGSVSSMNRNAIYSGFYGFVWLLGLALCFLIGFWPWILLPVVVSMVLGTLAKPLMAGIAGSSFLGNQQQTPYQQPVPQAEQPTYQPYQQGYQAQPFYQEGYQQEPYNQMPRQEYEQPQVQYPEQELPPMEQR
jgi:hypothetical protein